MSHSTMKKKKKKKKKEWPSEGGTIAGDPVVFVMAQAFWWSEQNWNPALRVHCALRSTMLPARINYSLTSWPMEGSFFRGGTKRCYTKGSLPNKSSILFLFRTTL